MPQGKIGLYKDTAGEWRFRFVAANGKIIAVSQGYKTKASCLKGVAAVVKVAVNHSTKGRQVWISPTT